MGEFNKLFLLEILLIFFKISSEQIIIPLNPMNNENGPTIMTRESFTVTSNDGSPITITRIGFHRNSKNLNGGGDDRRTPLDLMKLMDDRINSIFEEIISQRIGLRIIFNNQQNIKIDNDENKAKDEEKNKSENNENIDEKEFELDENKKEENKDINNRNAEKDKIQNKTEEKKQEENKSEENKDLKNTKNDNKKKDKKEKQTHDKKVSVGKLKVNPDLLKPKKRKKTLSQKEIIFSRVCKYIFYSLILFTFYILIRKLLELLEIIDPETYIGLKDIVKINNNDEKRKEVENKAKENENILNKKKENKFN
jgi:hypothetical protein